MGGPELVASGYAQLTFPQSPVTPEALATFNG